MVTFLEGLCQLQMTGFLLASTFVKGRHGLLPALLVLFARAGVLAAPLSRFGMSVSLHFAPVYPSGFTLKYLGSVPSSQSQS